VILLDQDKPLATTPYQEQPVILVVTRNGHLTEAVMEYSLNVAGRLNHRLLVAYVNTMPFLWDGVSVREVVSRAPVPVFNVDKLVKT
jgi:hypothetical protein